MRRAAPHAVLLPPSPTSDARSRRRARITETSTAPHCLSIRPPRATSRFRTTAVKRRYLESGRPEPVVLHLPQPPCDSRDLLTPGLYYDSIALRVGKAATSPLSTWPTAACRRLSRTRWLRAGRDDEARAAEPIIAAAPRRVAATSTASNRDARTFSRANEPRPRREMIRFSRFFHYVTTWNLTLNIAPAPVAAAACSAVVSGRSPHARVAFGIADTCSHWACVSLKNRQKPDKLRGRAIQRLTWLLPPSARHIFAMREPAVSGRGARASGCRIARRGGARTLRTSRRFTATSTAVPCTASPIWLSWPPVREGRRSRGGGAGRRGTNAAREILPRGLAAGAAEVELLATAEGTRKASARSSHSARAAPLARATTGGWRRRRLAGYPVSVTKRGSLALQLRCHRRHRRTATRRSASLEEGDVVRGAPPSTTFSLPGGGHIRTGTC